MISYFNLLFIARRAREARHTWPHGILYHIRAAVPNEPVEKVPTIKKVYKMGTPK